MISMSASPVTPVVPAACKGFFSAVQEGNILQAKLLHQAGTQVVVANSDGENALLYALKVRDRHKRLELFKWLLQLGVDVLKRDKKTNRDIVEWAAYLNRTPELKLAVEKSILDVDVGHIDNFGYSALHYAVFHNNTGVCRLFSKILSKFSRNFDIPDRNQVTPYLHAVRLGYQACAECLKPPGPDMTQGDAGRKIVQLQLMNKAREKDLRERTGVPTTNTATTNKVGQKHVTVTSKRPATSLCFPSWDRNTARVSGTAQRDRCQDDLQLTSTFRRKDMRRGCKSAPPACRERGNLSALPDDVFIPEVATPRGRAPPPPLSTSAHAHESYRSYMPALFSLYGDWQSGTILDAASDRMGQFVGRRRKTMVQPEMRSGIAAVRVALRLRGKLQKMRNDKLLEKHVEEA